VLVTQASGCTVYRFRFVVTKLPLHLFEQAIGKEYGGMQVYLHSFLNVDSKSPFTPPSFYCCTYWLDDCVGPQNRFGFSGEGKILYPSRQSNVLKCNIISRRLPVTTAATEKQQLIPFVLLSHMSLSTIKKYRLLHNNVVVANPCPLQQ
jgi:hypothetical protein